MSDILSDEILPGIKVSINPQNDRSRSILLEGVVDEVLTNAKSHPHGILVRLTCGEKGRVKAILDERQRSPVSSADDLSGVFRFDEITLPPWLASENPYFCRDLQAVQQRLRKKHDIGEWRDQYYDYGVCGCLQEITKLLEKSVETIFKMPLFMISESDKLSTFIYGKPWLGGAFLYRFASSTELLGKLQFVFNDRRKKEDIIDQGNYIDSDLGLFFEKISVLDVAAITSLNTIRHYRNYLSHPQNNVLSQSKTRFIVDYSLADYKEIYSLDTYLR